MIVVSDTSPINYLVLVGQVGRLYDLYGRVIVPPSVMAELRAPQSPRLVQEWLSTQPTWLEVQSPSKAPDPRLNYLGAGERDAIALAEELRADRLLIDDRDGRREAVDRDVPVVGTLGVLAQVRIDLIGVRRRSLGVVPESPRGTSTTEGNRIEGNPSCPRGIVIRAQGFLVEFSLRELIEKARCGS
jgi:predicted nucleic acid-binding protein